MGRLIYLNCDDNPTTFNKKNYLLRADERMGWGIFKNHSPVIGATDYILNIEPCTVLVGKKWTGIWHIDTIFDNEYHRHYPYCNTVFLATTETLHPEKRAEVLFQACDPVLHRRRPEIKQEYDYVLSGSMGAPYYTERIKAHDILKKHFTYYDHNNGHRPEDYVGRLNTAKVQFIASAVGPSGLRNAAQRFFECLAIGPVLVNWTPDLIHLGLVEDEDYIAYRNENEMISKMFSLVNDEKYRERIAINGRRKALLYHTYEHRAVSILNKINEYTANSA